MQEARLAKNWTPELAARETKIKVERLRDLEADDYSNFSSPTYARGFVRTYARALGLDEYRILRQLDNKLPDDDSANIVTDTGVAYLPETALPPRVAHSDYTGLYIVGALGAVIVLISAVVIFEAYRTGELPNWFANGSSENVAASTNAAPVTPAADTTARALPVDSNTPPPIADATTNAPAATNAAADNAPSTNPPRALPVDPSLLGNASTNAAPDAPVQSVRALPVNPADLANPAPPQAAANVPAPDTAPPAPRALPVNPADLTNAAPATTVALNNIPPAPVAPVAPPTPVISSSARQSNSGPVVQPAQPVQSQPPTAPTAPLAPPTDAPPVIAGVPVAPVATPVTDPAAPVAAPASTGNETEKRLVLTASQDSFVRVTNLDASQGDKPLYAAVLHSGQSIGFDGRKFSINVGIPSAVDIKLDGVNYGPHSDQDAPETFTVQSHLP